MAVLEKYEWSNMWWDEADKSGKRVLLIGDSIVTGYRSYVKDILCDDCFVDMYATSRAVDNQAYIHELGYMLEHCGLKYDVIHMNNGLHGFHQTIETYKEFYEKIIDYISSVSQQSKIIVALSTPITKVDLAEKFDEKNFIIQERNGIVRALCTKYHMQINDLYEAVAGNRTIRKNDGFHYSEEGYQLLAKKVSRLISNTTKTLRMDSKGTH